VLRTSIVGVVFSLVLTVSAWSQETTADGWTILLGPKTKFESNWVTKGNWVLDKDGVVSLEPRKGESGWSRHDMYLWLKDKTYTDFEIDFEYKVGKNSNSGFYFHVGDVKEPVKTGIEVQIYDSASKPATAKLNDHDSGGVIPGVPPTKNAAKAAGEWNRFQIAVKGKSLKVILNGETVNEVALDKGRLATFPSTGSIGFQDHALPISLRNIKIREIK